jgi:hypothetical protein
MSGSSAPMSVLCPWETLENSLPMVIPKRPPLFVSAINGQMGGHAMLDAQACAGFYFLHERIFCSYGLASKPPTQPSGFVPGCGWGGAALPLLNAGGIQGPDCVFAIFF